MNVNRGGTNDQLNRATARALIKTEDEGLNHNEATEFARTISSAKFPSTSVSRNVSSKAHAVSQMTAGAINESTSVSDNKRERIDRDRGKEVTTDTPLRATYFRTTIKIQTA